MAVYLLFGITIGIILGILIDKYLFVLLDVKLEKFTYKETVECAQYQVDAQTLVSKFQVEFGEVKELSPCVGFSVEPSQEIYEDEEEDKLVNRKMGF